MKAKSDFHQRKTLKKMFILLSCYKWRQNQISTLSFRLYFVEWANFKLKYGIHVTHKWKENETSRQSTSLLSYSLVKHEEVKLVGSFTEVFYWLLHCSFCFVGHFWKNDTLICTGYKTIYPQNMKTLSSVSNRRAKDLSIVFVYF